MIFQIYVIYGLEVRNTHACSLTCLPILLEILLLVLLRCFPKIKILQEKKSNIRLLTFPLEEEEKAL